MIDPKDLANVLDRAAYVRVNEMNDDRLFASEPGWIPRDLRQEEIDVIVRALRSAAFRG